MTIHRTTWPVFLPLFLALSVTPVGSARAETLDKSDFKQFEFVQHPALGFCPNLDAPSRATIVQQVDGSYLYEASVFVDGNLFFTRDLAARVLSDAEVQRIKEAFSSVFVTTGTFAENDPFDMFGEGIICIDPCRIISVQWDDMRFNDVLAGCIEAGQPYRLISSGELKEIIQLLGELDQESCLFDLCGICLIPASLGIVAGLSGMRFRRRRSRSP